MTGQLSIEADARLRVERDTPRSKVYEIFCAGCGERLVVGKGADAQSGVDLAVTNKTARPCCATWRT